MQIMWSQKRGDCRPGPFGLQAVTDISDLQLAQFGYPQPRRIERGEDGAVLEMARDGQYGGDLGLTEDGRQREGAPGRHDILQHHWAPQCDAIEEPQSTHSLHDGGPGNLFLLDQKELISADLLRTQVLGGGPEMLGEIGDTVQIRAHGMRRVVAELQIFQHALTQGGHARAYGPHEQTPSGEKVTIAAWRSRRARRSHCSPDSC